MRFLSSLIVVLGVRSMRVNRQHYMSFRSIKMKKEHAQFKNTFPLYQPKTENQNKYVKYLTEQKTKIVFAIGPAGTGKTLFACNQAIQDLKEGTINKIIITRPVVPVEEDIGFLPGNINKKMDPWMRPIFDIFLEFYSQRDIETMMQNGVIEISPLGYMRGRTFKKAFIIADEMQNSSPNQMMMLTTRIGTGTKMVVTGDLKQSDKGTHSGLLDFINKFSLYEKLFNKKLEMNKSTHDYNIGIKMVEFDNVDVERSDIVVRILDIYDFNNTKTELELLEREKNNAVISQKFYENINVTTNSADVTTNSTDVTTNSADAALIPRAHANNSDKFFKFFNI